MWELATISPVKHILRIDEDPASINKWLISITILSSLFEAILLPVLISLVWLILYKIMSKMNGSEYRLCMQATHGSVFKLFLDLFSRWGRLSENMLVFIILLLLMNILGKNVPNVMLAQIIGIHDFTKGASHDMVLFKNDSNCMYTSCTSGMEGNFALVLNSTAIQDIMHERHVRATYWDLNNNHNHTLYAVRTKVDTMSCVFKMGFKQELSSRNLTITNTSIRGIFTGSYGGHTTSTRYADIEAWPRQIILNTNMVDRCDIPMNMFYVSPDFNPNVTKMAKWLKDNDYYEDRPWDRQCEITLNCDAFVEWKKMRIVGDTPDETKMLEVNFDNSTEEFNQTFYTNVWDYESNGKFFGERLADSIIDKMYTIISEWRNVIKYKGSDYRYNFLSEYEIMISQSLASSIQSMMSDINVHVDVDEIVVAPGIWIEMTVLTLVIFLVCSILAVILTTKNMKMSLPLSSLDFGIISNAIFKEGNHEKISWPFVMVYSQDKSKHLVVANEID